MATRKCQPVLLLPLAVLLLVACATVEAPEQPEAITLGMGTTDGSCGTTLCCSNCPAIPVLRVIDGDTFITTGNQSVRLFGVDTPERGEECYREATARLRELAGDEVRVELGPAVAGRPRFSAFGHKAPLPTTRWAILALGAATGNRCTRCNLVPGRRPCDGRGVPSPPRHGLAFSGNPMDGHPTQF